MTTNDLIPHEFQELLLQVRGAGDQEFWTVGDVASALEGDCEGNPEKRRALRIAIADLAGVTAKTVGEYRAHAEFYPASVRAEYPGLTRWHFRHARRAGTVDKAQEWLSLVLKTADEYGGKPMPVDVLAAKMSEANGGSQPAPDWRMRLSRIRSALDALLALPGLPDPVREALRLAADALADALAEGVYTPDAADGELPCAGEKHGRVSHSR